MSAQPSGGGLGSGIGQRSRNPSRALRDPARAASWSLRFPAYKEGLTLALSHTVLKVTRSSERALTHSPHGVMVTVSVIKIPCAFGSCWAAFLHRTLSPWVPGGRVCLSSYAPGLAQSRPSVRIWWVRPGLILQMEKWSPGGSRGLPKATPPGAGPFSVQFPNLRGEPRGQELRTPHQTGWESPPARCS